MVGLSKIVTLLTTAMVVLCLIGVATPAFAQMYGDPYGGKGIPQAANVGANANMGMGKSIPQTSNIGGMGKGMPAANVGGMGKGANLGANVGGMGKGMPTQSLGKGMPTSNVGMGKGMPQTANVGANANMGLGKGMGKGGYGGGYGGYGTDMGLAGGYY